VALIGKGWVTFKVPDALPKPNPKNSTMAQFGKGSSSSKGKPSYFMSILGVTIVLLFWGLLGLLFIYLNNFRKNLSENVKINVYLTNTAGKAEIDSFINNLQNQPYTREVEFTDKEKAKQIMIGSKDESIDFGLIDEMDNPLPNTITFSLKSQYMIPDTLEAITKMLEKNTAIVGSTQYSKDVVDAINKSVKNIKIGLLIAAIVLSILVVLLIDNTIKLAMYSNRFLIKTMQMVGATRWFIAKPLDIRAIINGLISAAITIAILYGVVLLVEAKLPIREFRDMPRILMLFAGIIVVGVVITFASTHRSVIKYLRMKLDDLY
jgi:cell division transport system permease protein